MEELGQATSEIRNALDIGGLERFLCANIRGFKAPCDVKQFKLGQSNPTYLLKDSNSIRYVLRKKPPGQLLSSTAHAVEREYRVLDALNRSDHCVPVPKVYALCEDSSVIGTPFYIMEFVEGRIFSDVTLPSMSAKDRRQSWFSVIDALSALHAVDFRAVGLADFGCSTGFYTRQIKSLRRVSNIQAAVKDENTGNTVGDLPRLDELLEWFERNKVEDAATVIHGDFKMDNIVFHPTEPRAIAILDWELSTIGHPISDLANLLQPFSISHPTGLPADIPVTGLKNNRNLPPGIPTEEELLRYYSKKTGRCAIRKWDFCVAFSFFRLAVITQGIAARVARGQASSAEARTFAKLFVPMTMLALRYVDRGDLENSGVGVDGRRGGSKM